MKTKLTKRQIDKLKTGEWVGASLQDGPGSLVVRQTTAGRRFYFRAGKDGKVTIALASYTDTGEPITLAQAFKAASGMSRRYTDHGAALKSIIETERRERERERRRQEQAQQARQTRQTATLGALLTEYVTWQEKSGRIDHKDVLNLTRLHIRDAFPELWAKPAADISLDDVLDILKRPIKAGKKRTAGKLRAFLRAAFSCAIQSRTDADLSGFREFRLTTNPAAEVAAVKGGNNVRDRALSVAELRALWQRISKMDEPIGALIRFYLLTGGQRFAQLRRAKLSDVTDDCLVLRDHKGKRREPRKHVVPLLPEAVEAMEVMASPRLGDYVFTLTNGDSGADHAATWKRVALICQAMLAAGEIQERWTLSDLRRTVETRLAALGVPLDVRAQIQSHGLGGVQARHYDRHDYADEKREALERLRDLMTKAPATVTKIGTKSA